MIVEAMDDRARALYEHFEFLVPNQLHRLFPPMATIGDLFR